MSTKAEAAKVGLNFSVQQTKIREVDENAVNAGGCVIDGKENKRVDDFIYLGSTISASGKRTNEVKTRIRKVSGSFSHLSNIRKSKKMQLHAKMRVYNTTVHPTLLYDSET